MASDKPLFTHRPGRPIPHRRDDEATQFVETGEPAAVAAERIRAGDRAGAGAQVIRQRREARCGDGKVVHVLTALLDGLQPRIDAHHLWLVAIARGLPAETQERLLSLAEEARTQTPDPRAAQQTMAELRRLNLGLLAALDVR